MNSRYKSGRLEIKAAGDTSHVYIMGDIGSAWSGIEAKDLIPALADIQTPNIDIHVNSYGGDASQGIAIYNALRDHPANKTTYVEGFAASAASIIALAGDTIVMNRASQMMIHDALGAAYGNAEDMRKAMALMESVSADMAGIYADRAGGTPDQWRERMKAETWYNAEEAVKAGLADSAAGSDESGTQNRFRNSASEVVSQFHYVSRDNAPAPEICNKVADTDVSDSNDEQEPILQVDLQWFRDAFRGGK